MGTWHQTSSGTWDHDDSLGAVPAHALATFPPLQQAERERDEAQMERADAEREMRRQREAHDRIHRDALRSWAEDVARYEDAERDRDEARRERDELREKLQAAEALLDELTLGDALDERRWNEWSARRTDFLAGEA